eukprot:scaffold224512_cov35-Tisochrysis_lutea.AAC.2
MNARSRLKGGDDVLSAACPGHPQPPGCSPAERVAQPANAYEPAPERLRADGPTRVPRGNGPVFCGVSCAHTFPDWDLRPVCLTYL